MAINLIPIGTYETGAFDEGAAEIVAHDPASQRLFVVNGATGSVDILDISDPDNPTLVSSITPAGIGGINSVAVKNGIVAIAAEADPVTDPGQVLFYDTDGAFLNAVQAGALPDMVTFTPDGLKVLVANEGEPSEGVNPQGSITIVDLSGGVLAATVTHADFTAFDGREAELRTDGVRIFPNNAASVDLEPEYIAVSPDGTMAFVTLQEANSFAVVDIATGTIKGIVPLGVKDHSQDLPTLEQYTLQDQPVLGTTPAGQEILLGGTSGLHFLGESNGVMRFLTVPDRGPNGEPTNTDGDAALERPFALPEYQARIIVLELDTATGQLTVDESSTILLTRPDGVTPITGLPNIPGVDEEPVDLFGDLLPYDPFGADLEGIVLASDGTYWMVDEYRPAIYHFSATGVMIDRFVPEGTAALAGGNPGDFGTETLPADYVTRRANRGFEAVALDDENGILYAFIQTPLANPNTPTSNASDAIRMLGIDVTTGLVVREYVYQLEKPEVNVGDVVDKIGDAVYAGDGKFYVMERDSSVTAEAKKFIFEIDIKGATNLADPGAPAIPAGETIESLTADQRAALGIESVDKIKVANIPSLGYLAGDKTEGITVLPDGRLAIINDNDFGLLPQQIAQDGSAPLSPNPTPVVLGIIGFDGRDNGLDPSDRDGGVAIENHPIFGLFQPDGIKAYEADGKTYYVTANEGDTRDEIERVKDLVLDPEAFPNAAELQADEVLGRLEVSTIDGDIDGDGDFDQLFVPGGRSFSIWDAQGNLVFDSGSDFERIIANINPDFFNVSNDANEADARSDAKGPEPEAIEIAELDGRTIAFIGLERDSGIMIYDITDPHAPSFLRYLNNRDYFADPESNAAGDLGPEGLHFISAAESPTGKPLLAVANEVSGTTTLYEVYLDAPKAVLGNAHGNKVEGKRGDDFILGFEGRDRIDGNSGDDWLGGGDGRDKIDGGRGDDWVSGGDDDDEVEGGVGDDTVMGGSGRDRAEGGDGDDTVSGGADDDRVYGGSGKDKVFGDAGDDHVDGGSGDDMVEGGEGKDYLIGGHGKDMFVFGPDSGADTIKDFKPGYDVIDLRAYEFASIAEVLALIEPSGGSGGGHGSHWNPWNHWNGWGHSKSKSTIIVLDEANGDSIELLGVRPHQIDANDFLIA
jgi:hypothetical protein